MRYTVLVSLHLSWPNITMRSNFLYLTFGNIQAPSGTVHRNIQAAYQRIIPDYSIVVNSSKQTSLLQSYLFKHENHLLQHQCDCLKENEHQILYLLFVRKNTVLRPVPHMVSDNFQGTVFLCSVKSNISKLGIEYHLCNVISNS